jgi:hypothetical protein
LDLVIEGRHLGGKQLFTISIVAERNSPEKPQCSGAQQRGG